MTTLTAPPRVRPSTKPAPGELRSNLRSSTTDANCYCLMMGFGEANIVLFALSLGLGEVLSGLVGSVPLLSGAILQLITPAMVRRFGSHKKWILICAVTQAITFLPLALGGLLGYMHPFLVFLVAALYWAAAMGAGAPWNTFISQIVPRRVRSLYFSRRSRWANLCLVSATILAGVIVDFGLALDDATGKLHAFALLFLIAAAARFSSAYFLSRQVERIPIPPDHRDVPVRELIGRFRHGPGGRLIAYMLTVQFSIQIFTPFLNPYLFEQLQLKQDFTLLALINATQMGAKILAMPMIGLIAHRYGPLRVVWIGGLAIVPLPLLWMAETSVPYLILVQLISGAALACYEMGTFLLLFEAIPDGERTSVMVRYVLCNHIATTLGSFVGASLLQFVGADGVGTAGYTAVFAASALARFGAVALLARITLPADLPETPETAEMRIRPQGGTLDDPLLPTMPAPREPRP